MQAVVLDLRLHGTNRRIRFFARPGNARAHIRTVEIHQSRSAVVINAGFMFAAAEYLYARFLRRAQIEREHQLRLRSLHAGQNQFAVNGFVLRFYRILTVVLHFADGRLIQLPALQAEFARKSHCSGPVMRLRRQSAIPHLHPGNHDDPPVRRRHRLRRIEIESAVDLVFDFALKRARRRIQPPRHIQVAVQVLIPPALRGKALGTGDEHVRSVDHRKIGTFVNPVRPAVFPDGAHKSPIGQIRRFIQQQLPGPVVVAGTDDRIIAAVPPKDFRIAEIRLRTVGRNLTAVDHAIDFLKM